MAKKYPLEQLAFIKKKKLDEAERILRDKREELLTEQKKLTKVEKARDEVKKHKLEKLQQLRDAMDEGERADKIEQGRHYLKLVEEKLIIEEKKVTAQKEQVKKAEEAVEAARQDMLKRQKEVEKFKEHKELWRKEMLKEIEKEEAKEADEIGSSRFTLRKRKQEGE